MHNPTPHEIEAMRDAGDRAGEHLDRLGKTDLATMDENEWMTFIETVCDGFIDGMNVRARLWFREAEPPF